MRDLTYDDVAADREMRIMMENDHAKALMMHKSGKADVPHTPPTYLSFLLKPLCVGADDV